MFGLVRTAVRFFFIGFGVGVLLAPRSGVETRALIREKINVIANAMFEIVSVPEEQRASDVAPQPRSAGAAIPPTGSPDRVEAARSQRDRARPRRAEGPGGGA